MKNLRAINLNKLGLVFLVLIALLIISSCKQTEQENVDPSVVDGAEENEGDPITLLTSPWPPDALNYLAQEKGFFEKHGVEVELLWADGYEATFEQFEAGDLDVVNTTLLDAVNYQAENGVGVAIFVQDYSAGADAVVALDGIEAIVDLKGKKVGVESGTVGEFFLQILLEREGLSLADLEIVDTASEAVLVALQDGSIDAGVCYEPCPADTKLAGGKAIVDSAKERDLIVDVYMAKEDHVEANKDEYVKVLNALIDAGEYFNENPEESAEIMAEVLDIPVEEVVDIFTGLRIPSFRDNQTAFNRSSGFNSLYNLAKLASQYLEDQGLIDGSFDTDLVIYPDLVEAIDR